MRGYRGFHGLSGPAFGKAIPRADLLAYDQLHELTGELETLLGDGGVGVLTGEMGMGKTTAVRHFLGTLEERSCQVAYQGSSRHSGAVLEGLVEQLGPAPARHRSSMLRQISKSVARTYAEQRRKTLLIFDDAQLLEDSLLEDLRLLTNFGMDAEEPLMSLFIGHPALRLRLLRPVHLALWDRVRMQYRLEGLSQPETSEYIDCHLRAAGAPAEVFTPEAKQAIFEHAQGIPRRINALALDLLKESARRKQSPIDAALVALVAARKQS
jgi:type II secretory pathway predicted ATPase ExeA